jgi:trimeric autotransporter adhesin
MRYLIRTAIAAFSFLSLAACSSENSRTANIDPITGKHPVGWVVSTGGSAHPAAFHADQNSCAACHGSDLHGGISTVSCFSTDRNGISCHPNGPGSVAHAIPFTTHTISGSAYSTNCQRCHQEAANGTTKPPGCMNCHISSPVATPSGCSSCHGAPPNGTVYPNIAATHGAHVSANKVANLILACDDCHSGLGSPTLDHYHRAKARTASGRVNPVAFSNNPLIVAGGGSAPAFNDTTDQCANTYCHGAKMPHGDIRGSNRTPIWNAPFLPANISLAVCGTCHGFPPSTTSGHPAVATPTAFPIGTGCNCHGNVNAAGTSYATIFVDKSLHIDGAVDGTGSCIGCHSSIQPGTHGTPRDAVVNEFGLAWGHKKAGRGSITDADCIVCHLEGNFTTQAPSSRHMDGNIDLRDPDGVGEVGITNISGSPFIFTKFAISYIAGQRTSSGHLANDVANVISQKFCLACHDSNGATNTTARSNNGGTGTAAMPFGGIPLGAAYTAANNAIGTQGLIDVKTQTLPTNASAHPIQGPRNRAYPTPARFNAPYNNFTRTPPTRSDGVVLNCFDCHTTPALLTTRTIVAHGNAVTLRGNIWTNPDSLCTACHIPNVSGTTNGQHGAGSAFASGTNSGMQTYINARCEYCHSSNTASPGRPIRAQDVHGFDRFAGAGADSIWPKGATNTYKPYAFMRNTVNWGGTISWKPLSGTGVPAGTATCGGGALNSLGCTGENMTTYTPGGTY